MSTYIVTKEKKVKKDATFMTICCLAWPLAEIVARIYLVKKNVSQSGSSFAELFEVSEN